MKRMIDINNERAFSLGVPHHPNNQLCLADGQYKSTGNLSIMVWDKLPCASTETKIVRIWGNLHYGRLVEISK